MLACYPPIKVPSPTMSFDTSRGMYIPPPPAPPPTQPLPEAPPEAALRNKRAHLPGLQPMLRRSETERPKGTAFGSGRSSPTKHAPALQIRTLVDALNTAQKEISSQNEKIKEVEETLRRERQDRNTNEDRPISVMPILESTTLPETDVSRLQSLVETMRAEMEEMKIHMERYRQRAETAEEKSKQDRQSLAEMVESIKKREELARRRKARNRVRASERKDDRDSDSSDEDELEELESRLEAEADSVADRLNGFPKPPRHLPNGTATSTSPVSVAHLQELGKAAFAAILPGQSSRRSSAIEAESGEEGVENEKYSDALDLDGHARIGDNQGILQQKPHQLTRAQEHFVQGAPYASFIGVVLLGVGMMAYLNGWQKVVDR